MKNIKLFIIFLILYILPIYAAVSPITSSSNIKTITFEYGSADEYYTKWTYTKAIDSTTGYMNFTCSDPVGTANRICTHTFTMPLKSYFFSKLTYCTNAVTGACTLEVPANHYPVPIITTVTTEVYKDLQAFVEGAFIKFLITPAGTPSTPLISGSTILVLNSDKTTFDPTKAELKFPDGCGAVNITFSPTSNYTVQYKKPIVNVEDPGTGLQSSGNSYQLIGSNFCQSPTATLTINFGGKLIQSSDIIIDSDSKLNFTLNNDMPEFASNVPVSVGHSNGGLYSDAKILTAPPRLESVTSASLKGGIITITGKRLFTTSGKDTKVSIYINSIVCNANMAISSPTKVICELKISNVFGEFPIIYNADTFTYGDLIFKFGVPAISQISAKANTLTLHGTCLGSTNVVTSFITVTNSSKPFETANVTINSEESISFELYGGPFGNVNITLTNTYTLTNGTLLNRTLIYSYELPLSYKLVKRASYKGDPFLFLLYFIKSEYRGVMPILSVEYGLNLKFIVGTTVLELNEDSTGGEAFLFNLGNYCGSGTGSIKIGSTTQEASNITLDSLKPAFRSNSVCASNGTDINCVGENFNIDDSVINFSGKLITPYLLNDTSFSFKILDNFFTDNITINSCGQSDFTKVTLNPVYTHTKSNGLSPTGGFITIYGKHFTAADFQVTCPSKNNTNNTGSPITNPFTDPTFITVQILYGGPSDIECTFVFQSKKETITLQFHEPTIIATNSLYPEYGGELILYGNNFYNDPNFTISVGNLQCLTPTYISTSSIYCQLPGLTDLGDTTTLYNLINVSVTMFGKTGISPVFKYTHYSDGLPNDYSGEYSHLVYLIIPIVIGFASVYLAFGYLLYKKSLNQN